MNVHKKIIYISTIVLLLLGLIAVFLLTRGDGTGIREGIYRIEDNSSYPDAYISIKSGQIQFFNIDLNAYYLEKKMAFFRRRMELTETDVTVSDAEIRQAVDVNLRFVDEAFDISDVPFSKVGTKRYCYMLYYGEDCIVIHYDTSSKRIILMDSGEPILNFSWSSDKT